MLILLLLIIPKFWQSLGRMYVWSMLSFENFRDLVVVEFSEGMYNLLLQ